MNTFDKENLYRLFRYHGNVIGAARMTIMSLTSMINAIQDIKSGSKELVKLYNELSNIIKNSEPKVIPLIHLLEQFETEIEQYVGEEVSDELSNHFIRILSEKIALYEFKANAVTRHGLESVADGDTIVVHSASSVVTNILIQSNRLMRRKFKVVILKLDPIRTPQVVKAMQTANIEHSVIPEYNLCHHIEEANKLFIGALTVTRDSKVVAPVGTANVLGLCHVNGVKSYLFANTLHYSHGIGTSQRIHKEETSLAQSMSTYCLTTYSHDLVELRLMDTIVNEDGIVSHDTINEI